MVGVYPTCEAAWGETKAIVEMGMGGRRAALAGAFFAAKELLQECPHSRGAIDPVKA